MAVPIAPPHPQHRPAATSPTAGQTRLRAPSGATAPLTLAPKVVDHNNLHPLSNGRHQPRQWVQQYLFAPPPRQNQSAPTQITGTAISIAPPPLRTSLYRPHQRAPHYLLPSPPSVSLCQSYQRVRQPLLRRPTLTTCLQQPHQRQLQQGCRLQWSNYSNSQSSQGIFSQQLPPPRLTDPLPQLTQF